MARAAPHPQATPRPWMGGSGQEGGASAQLNDRFAGAPSRHSTVTLFAKFRGLWFRPGASRLNLAMPS